MEKTRGKEEANKLKLKYNRENKNLRKALRDKENYFKTQISNVKTAEEFEELQIKISQYNTKSINENE